MKKIVINSDNRRFNISSIVVGYLEENKEEVLEFEIPEKYAGYGKKACFSANGQTFAKTFDDVISNKLTITRDISQFKELDMTIAFFKIENEDEVVARTSILHILIENAIICDDDIKPDEPKIIILDNLIDEVTKLDVLITKNEKKREEYYQEIQKKVDNGDFNGATFTPIVDDEGNISWSNDKNLSNPTTQNIKGPKGPKGDTYTLTEQDKKDISSITVESSESSFNQYYNGKLEDFNSNATSKTNDYNTNATNKTTEYNNNAISKVNEFNTNAGAKLQEYNTNADNKIAEYDLHSQELNNKIVSTRNELERVKNDVLETGTDTDTYIHLQDSAMAEYQELSVDGVCEQETTSIANGDEYDSPSPYYPQEIKTIENSLKITSCNKNLFNKNNPFNYGNGTDGKIVLLDDATIQTTANYGDNRGKGQLLFLKNNTIYTISGNLLRADGTGLTYNAVLEIMGEKNGKRDIIKNYLFNRSVSKPFSFKMSFDTKDYINMSIHLSSWDVDKSKSPISIFNDIQLEENTTATPYEQHLETQITANLPEGEFVGKLNDTYKDTLKVEYNEEDGQYHLNLYKRVYKNNSYNGESYNYYISTTARKDGNIECGELQTGQVVYYVEDETIIDLGIVDMPITYNEITNLFTDSDLMPTINAKYYRNFISTVRNIQVNEKALKQELIDINNRLSALETAQTNVASESGVVE